MKRQTGFLFFGLFAVIPHIVGGAASSEVIAPARTQVYSEREVDQPPKLMFMKRPDYPAELKKDKVAGEVVVECIVDLDGSVRDAVVSKSTRQEFDLPALRAVSKWKYRPGKKDKKDVNVRLLVSVKFEAPK